MSQIKTQNRIDPLCVFCKNRGDCAFSGYAYDVNLKPKVYCLQYHIIRESVRINSPNVILDILPEAFNKQQLLALRN